MFMLVNNSTGITPTLLKLKIMRRANGKPLDIVQEIAAGDYMTFGIVLLQDENGDEMEIIKKKHKHDGTMSVVQAILKRWLTSDSLTHTYHHLLECLRVSELGELADDIVKGNHKI